VSGWDSIFLGTIAAATLLMALLQAGAVIAGARALKRIEQLAEDVQRDVRPLIARASEIADDARRAAALGAQQVERVDRMMADLTQRLSETAELLQQTVARPIREGSAVIAGLKAGLAAIRGLRGAGRSGRLEDEDALFIG
jgi:hypothetical protein